MFLVGLIAFVAVVWLPTSWSEDSAELWVAKDRTIDLFCRWLRTLVCLLVVAGMIELPLYAMRASGEALSSGVLEEALFGTWAGLLWTERIAFGIIAVAAGPNAAAAPLGAR